MNEVPEQKPFLRWNNPLLWVMGIAGFMIYQHEKKGKSKQKKNPRLPDELPVRYGSGREFVDEHNPVMPCMMTGNSLARRNPLINGLLISAGNTKVGKIWNWSLPAGPPPVGSCPGATEWCKKFCYAQTGQAHMMGLKGWRDNYRMAKQPDFANRMIQTLSELGKGTAIHVAKDGKQSKVRYTGSKESLIWNRYRGRVLRIHVGGDFFSKQYIEDWIKIAKSSPDWRFYTYTRCWVLPEFMPLLESFRKLPNVVMMASTDMKSNTSTIPRHWREAGVVRTWFGRAIMCPALDDRVTEKRRKEGRLTYIHKGVSHYEMPCSVCGHCFSGSDKGVYFPVHSVGSEKQVDHDKMVKEAGWA